jgi:two-component sensor histidine kinase
MSSKHQSNTAMSSRGAPETGFAAIVQENARLRFTVMELHHRTKNLVAIIQSIARQTMRQTVADDNCEVRFAGRLDALGRSLDLLTDGDWRGARLDELVRQQLAPFGHLDGDRISAQGPPIGLNPEAARNIGLALHELATNASKYGALSVPEGKVAVRWKITRGSAPSRFIMTWREANGPTVTAPEHRGFGRQVLQQVAAQALSGKVMHKFLPKGVRWTLDIPAAAILNSCGVPASTPVGLEGRRNWGDRHVGQ